MLGESDLRLLDDKLLELHSLVLQDGEYDKVRSFARKIANSVTEEEGKPGEFERKLLRVGWEDAWKKSKQVYSGWFYNDCLDDESTDALFAVFTEIVRYLVDATTPHRQKTYLSKLRDAIADYLGLRGTTLPSKPKGKRRKTHTPLLEVSIEKISATLNGREYDLTGQQQARWLNVLADNQGVWISGPRLELYDPELFGARTDRLRRDLPQEISSLIEISKRNGARLKLG